MYFDVYTIYAVVDELEEKIIGGRIQKIYDLNDMAVGFEVYANRQRHYLILNADPTKPYVNLLDGKLRRGLPLPTQLGLLMRRFVDGGVISGVTQPPWERMIILHVDSAEGTSDIVVETIERRTNILLVQEGMIMDCIRRVRPSENRVRVSLPGHEYVPPPPQKGKTNPAAIMEGDIAVMLDSDPGTNAWRTLTRGIVGVSPVLAREIIFQATGKANAKAADTSAIAVYDTFNELVMPLLDHEWTPGVIKNEDGQVTSYAPFPIAYQDGWEPVDSISQALTAYYGAPVGEDAYKRAKKPVRVQVQDAISRVGHKLDSLESGLKTEEELEAMRQKGELLLAYQYAIERGATEYEAQYDMDGPPIVIKLDPSLSALDNAKRYFARYEKAKRAQKGVPARVRATKIELTFLHQLDSDLDMASSWPEIDEVREALEQNNYWRGEKQARPKSGKSAPRKLITDEGFLIWIGRNSRQNEQVTFNKGGADDLWLHARGIPGSHVLIRSDGRDVPENVLIRAAELAAYYSTSRGEGRVTVDITERKYVKKIRGGKPGMVTYRNEETRTVAPRGLED